MWTCPDCGRRFARTGQTHSCSTATVDDHFPPSDAAGRQLFNAFQAMVAASGPYELDVIGRGVGFRGRSRVFARVWRTRAGLQGYLDLPGGTTNEHLHRTSPYGRLTVGHFTVTGVEGFDEGFQALVRLAYSVGG